MLLFVVLWVLIFAVFTVYVFMPIVDENELTSSDILYAGDELTMLEHDAGKVDTYADANRKLNEKLAESTSSFYDTMRNSEADKMLISLIESCGCKATGLGIEDAVAIEDSGLVAPYTEITITESSDSSDSSESSDAAGNTDLLDNAEKKTDTVNETVIYTGITMIAATYEITADYPQLLKVIDKINADKSLAIAKISYEQDTTPIINEDESVTLIQAGEDLPIQITVLVFMYPQA